MQKILVVIFVAVIGACVFATGAAHGSNDIRSQYDGSSDLPDQIAYVEFLRLVRSGANTEDRLDLEYVAKATGIRLVEDGDVIQANVRRAENLLRKFQRSLSRLEQERKSTRKEVLCTEANFQTADQIFNSMNAVDDINEAMANKQYQIDLNRLRASERVAFLDYLADLKKGISYVKLDARTQMDDAFESLSDADRSSQVRYGLEQYCARLASK